NDAHSIRDRPQPARETHDRRSTIQGGLKEDKCTTARAPESRDSSAYQERSTAGVRRGRTRVSKERSSVCTRGRKEIKPIVGARPHHFVGATEEILNGRESVSRVWHFSGNGRVVRVFRASQGAILPILRVSGPLQAGAHRA